MFSKREMCSIPTRASKILSRFLRTVPWTIHFLILQSDGIPGPDNTSLCNPHPYSHHSDLIQSRMCFSIATRTS
jgi:hypothetical protein